MSRPSFIVAFALALTFTRSARAEAVVSLHAMEGKGAWNGGLHASDGEPDVLAAAAPRLVGARTSTTELGLQVAVIASRMRFGFVESVFMPRDLRVTHDPLPQGFSADGGTAWGGRFEAFLGRELGRPGSIAPWIDVSVGASMLSASLNLRHETFGALGDTHYLRIDPIVAPRVGLRVPFAEYGALELMARRDLIGPGRLYLGIAIAVTTFRND